MSVLQKQNMAIRLVGLDQKANPRTTVPGTIVDGLNFTMNKDGRIEKRPGSASIAMLDTFGNTLVGRELTALGDELVMRTARDWYARNPQSGQWVRRGRAAYERMIVREVAATNADCNGVDSRLEIGAAQIGNTRLIVTSGGRAGAIGTSLANMVVDGAECSWILTDATTGEALIPRQSMADYRSIEVGTDGSTFVCFAADGANLRCGVWASDFRSITWSVVVSDLGQFPDSGTYSLQEFGAVGASFATLWVGTNTWLITYLRSDGAIVVKRIGRSGTSFSTSSAGVVATNIAFSVALGWAYAGGATAYVAGVLGSTIYYAVALAADGTISGQAAYAPFALVPTHHAITGFVTDAPHFLIDTTTADGRSVYLWKATATSASIAVRDAGLLTQAFYPVSGETNEIGVGIAYPSTWQPSSVMLRMAVASGAVTWRALAAHIHNGNFAGTTMRQKVPAFASGIVPIGILTNPVSVGGPGTVTIGLAEFPADSTVQVSPPAENAGTLVCPGAILKSYDGTQVTEAAFVVGPEKVAAAEGTYGRTFAIDSTGAMIDASEQQLAPGVISRSFVSGAATFQLETKPGSPGLTAWPAGTISIHFSIRIVNPTVGQSYQIATATAGEFGALYTSTTNYGYQAADINAIALSGTWWQTTITVPAPALPSLGHGTPTAADRLVYQIRVVSTLTSGESATVELSYGGDMPFVMQTPFPKIETGTRQYVACAAWTDSRGRLQRSQVCPPSSNTNNNGLVNLVTVPMVSLTERNKNAPVYASLDTMAPVEIEVYRTQVNSSIFYRVGAVANTVNGDPQVLVDSTNDLDLSAAEKLYTTGNAVENWPPIGCNLVSSHQGRIFVATADNQVFFTAYNQSGEGLAFASEYQVETSHIPGRITALLSLDDKEVIATAKGYAVLAGVGPEVIGTPPYDSPMLVSSGIGPDSQRTCARLPEGFTCMTAHGLYMMDRGLNLTFIGLPVTDDAPGSASWYTAAYHPTSAQVRVFGSAKVLVQDQSLPPAPSRSAQWFPWVYPQAIVATAAIGQTLWMLGANGTVYQADTGYSDAGTAYQEWFKLSVVSPADVGGWSRIHALELQGVIAATDTLKITFSTDEGAAADTTTKTAGVTALNKAIAKPRYGKVSGTTIWIGENAATTLAGIIIDALTLQVGLKGGLGRLQTGNRMGRS